MDEGYYLYYLYNILLYIIILLNDILNRIAHLCYQRNNTFRIK